MKFEIDLQEVAIITVDTLIVAFIGLFCVIALGILQTEKRRPRAFTRQFFSNRSCNVRK